MVTKVGFHIASAQFGCAVWLNSSLLDLKRMTRQANRVYILSCGLRICLLRSVWQWFAPDSCTIQHLSASLGLPWQHVIGQFVCGTNHRGTCRAVAIRAASRSEESCGWRDPESPHWGGGRRPRPLRGEGLQLSSAPLPPRSAPSSEVQTPARHICAALPSPTPAHPALPALQGRAVWLATTSRAIAAAV